MRRFFVESNELLSVCHHRFCDEPLANIGMSFVLPEAVYHHWVRVLRASVGDQAIIFNGFGGEYLATLSNITKKSAEMTLHSYQELNRDNGFTTTLGLVMSKGDRMDYALQKATELGVTTIQLLTSERCEERLKYERDQKKISHWQSVVISACEQCGLNIVPKVLAPMTLIDWVNQQALLLNHQSSNMPHSHHIGYVLAPELPEQLPIFNVDEAKKATAFSLLIGSEGGLSEQEVLYSQQHGFRAWQIGQRVLRTETAPVVALSTLINICDS